MECNCGLPVRQTIYKDGRPCYSCAYGGCRFFGFAPVHCEGYQRIIPTNKTPAETCIVRFEALLHPLTHAPSVMANIYTPNDVAGRATEAGVRLTLEAPELSPSFYVPQRAYLYPMAEYAGLVAKLKALPHVLVQEIPAFFFRSVNQTKQLPAKYAEAVAARTEDPIDTADDVYVRLKNFQKKGVEFIITHGGRGMIADDMGLGKTVQAIAVAHHYRTQWPVLVVCPMSLIENWAKEFNKFCSIPFSRIAILQGTKARPESIHEVVIVSYSSLKCVEGLAYKVVILDESHYIKAADSRRSQSALRICHAAERVLLLSGTPAMSRPMEMYTQLSAIHANMVPTKTQYAARYCNGHLGRFGMDYQGHSHINELHYLIQDFVIRRTKKELSEAELPSKSRQLLYVYITAKEKKALEKQVLALRKSVMDRNPSGGLGSSGGSGGGGEIASRAPNAFELKIATAKAKIPAVQDYVSSVVEQHLESREKIIFFAHHQCMMEAIKAAVVDARPKQPIDYIYITGETPAAQREQLATHFRQEPTCTVAILSMGSSGTGHNFTCASTVVFAELDWNPSTHLQCEDRVHRIGQTHSCTIKYLLADGTSDDVIWPMLQTKLTVTSAVLESTVATNEANRLSENADKQKISRRDVSTEGSSAPTQNTLDGFLKTAGSHAGSQAPARSASGSASAPVFSPCTRVEASLVVDGVEVVTNEKTGHDGDGEDVTLISADTSRSGIDAPATATAAKHGATMGCVSSHGHPVTFESLLTPPPQPADETQTPHLREAASPATVVRSSPLPTAPIGTTGGTPPPGRNGDAVTEEKSSATKQAFPVVVTIEELHRCPQLSRPVYPNAHRTKGRGSQGHGGASPHGASHANAVSVVFPSNSTSGGGGTNYSASGRLHGTCASDMGTTGVAGGAPSPPQQTATSVLDLLVRKSQTPQPLPDEGGDVILLGEGKGAAGKRRTTFQLGSVPTPPVVPIPVGNQGSSAASVSVPTVAASATRVSHALPTTTTTSAVMAVSAPLHSATAEPSSVSAPFPRRTTFTLKPPTPAVAPLPQRTETAAAQTHVIDEKSAVHQPPATSTPVVLLRTGASSQRPSGGGPHTIAHVPLNILKRPRASAGEGTTTITHSEAPTTTLVNPPTPVPLPHQPVPSVPRVEPSFTLAPEAIIGLASPAPPAGRRTTFRLPAGSPNATADRK